MKTLTTTRRCWSVLLLLSCWRGVQGQQQTADYDYYDFLRNNTQEVQSSNESHIFRVTDTTGNTYRLADISGFMPFSDGTVVRAKVENEAIAALLAVYHFNNPHLSPSLLTHEDCNVRLTTELLDTQFSPINSTRLFAKVLLRNHSLTTPLPTSVVGAYRSATTSPLAILTGVNEIPQISPSSTSTDFEVKEQYPIFGRTIPSTIGEAKVAVDYFSALGATHVAILFVTDSFGSALQKAFQDAAAAEGITTASVAFSYSANVEGDEIPNAIDSIASTQFRFIYAISFELHYDPIMLAAYKRGLTGGDYLWIFPGFDMIQFQSNAKYETGSPLALASQGIGLVQPSGGFSPEIVYPDSDVVYPLEENPVTGFQKLRKAWREALDDPVFVEYVHSKIPESVKSLIGYFPGNYGLEPTQRSPMIYDAFIGLGLSMCRAGAEAEFFTGPEIYEQFRNLEFEGTSGTVKITPETGTRDYTSTLFGMWNVQNYNETDDQGRVQFQLAPTNYYENTKWNAVKGMTFVYGDGGTQVPSSLPPVQMDMNYIGDAGIIVGYVLMGLVMAVAIACFVWLVWFRNHKVVSSAQPLFLLMVAIGAFIMASTIVPMSLQEPINGLDVACMATPWLYITGAAITFSPLFAKTRGIYMAYKNPELDFIHVTSNDIFMTLSIVYSLNLVVLITWTVVAPLEWTRTFRDSTDIFDRYVESYGSCSNEDALPFVIVILVLNVGFLLLANLRAYQSRNIETEYHESRYIGISMASVLQAWCMGVPIMIVVWDNPSAKFFVGAGIVFVTALAVLLLIYIPKVLAIRADRIQRMQEEKRSAYSRFTDRSRRNQFDDSDDSEGFKNIARNETGANSSDEAAQEDTSSEHKTSDTTGATTSSEFGVKPAAKEDDEGVDAAIAAAVAVAPAVANGSTSSSSSRHRSSISSRLLSPGAMKADENSEGVGGIKVIHNPRSERNLQLSMGREMSRGQLDVCLSEEQEDDKEEEEVVDE